MCFNFGGPQCFHLGITVQEGDKNVSLYFILNWTFQLKSIMHNCTGCDWQKNKVNIGTWNNWRSGFKNDRSWERWGKYHIKHKKGVKMDRFPNPLGRVFNCFCLVTRTIILLNQSVSEWGKQWDEADDGQEKHHCWLGHSSSWTWRII